MYIWIPAVIIGSVVVVFVAIEIFLHATAKRMEMEGTILETYVVLQAMGGGTERIYWLFDDDATGKIYPVMVPKVITTHRFLLKPGRKARVKGKLRWSLGSNPTVRRIMERSDVDSNRLPGLTISRIFIPRKVDNVKG